MKDQAPKYFLDFRQAARYTRALARDMEEWSRHFANFDLDDWDEIRVVIGTHERWNNSWGGNNGVFLAIREEVTGDDVFTEYGHIKHDDDIGAFEGPIYQRLAALTTHEMAHSIEQQIGTLSTGRTGKGYSGHITHDEDWQDVYRILRNTFVNGEENEKWLKERWQKAKP
jgi:hypothetical protein